MDDTPRLRLSILGIVCVSLFASLTARLWYLQAIDREEFAATGETFRLRTVKQAGPRGRVLDRNGKILVDNRLSVVVGIVRDDVNKLSEQETSDLYGALADKFNRYDIEALKRADIADAVNDPRYKPLDFIPLYRDAPAEMELFFAEHREEYPGVRVRRETVRTYPYGHIGASILGYVGQIAPAELEDKDVVAAAAKAGKPYIEGGDEIGKGGVEQSMEADLRGTPGTTTVEVSRTGEVVQVRDETPPEVGSDVWLNIDIDAQAWAEHVLKANMRAVRGHLSKDGKVYRAPEGAAAIVSPHDGSIVALASVPTYDPSALVGGISTDVWNELNDPKNGYPLNNWAVSGQFPPGSTFKLISLYAALENNMFGPGNPPGFEDSSGKYTIADCEGPTCTRQNAGGNALGFADPQTSITISSDVFYYWLADRMWQGRALLGETPIQDAGTKFGLGEKTGIPLAGERGGRLPTPELFRERYDDAGKNLKPGETNPMGRRNWTAGDNVNMSIGQGEVLVTPLQLANAYATLANGGTHYKPLLVQKVTKPTDANKDPLAADNPAEEVQVFNPVVKNQLTFGTATDGRSHLEVLQAGFQGVISNGRGTANKMWEETGGLPGIWSAKTGTAELGTKSKPKADGSVFALYGPVDAPFGPNYAISVIIPESGFGADTAGPTAVRIMAPLVNGNLPPAPKVDEDRALPPVPPLKVKP